MGKGLFLTATGTDVGKTYVAALLVKTLHQAGYQAGYYKAALSGAPDIPSSDAGYVKHISGIQQPDETLLSYLYQAAVSPHLAAQWQGNPVELSQVRQDYQAVQQQYDYVTVEGSGGIVCPIRWDAGHHILLEDIIRLLDLDTLVVADAGLGTINAVTLTTEYLCRRNIGVKGIILNRYTGTPMEQDNQAMIQQLTGLPVLATVAPNAQTLALTAAQLAALYR